MVHISIPKYMVWTKLVAHNTFTDYPMNVFIFALISILDYLSQQVGFTQKINWNLIAMHLLSRLINFLLMLLVKIYQLILSPIKYALFGQYARCKFRITCSAFTIKLLKKYQTHKAIFFSLRRILRCNNFWHRKI